MATYPRIYRETEAPGLLAAYMTRIGRGELLSHREEVELGRRARAGASSRRTCGWPSQWPRSIAGRVCLSKTSSRRGISGS